jgi:hypothetical protein
VPPRRLQAGISPVSGFAGPPQDIEGTGVARAVRILLMSDLEGARAAVHEARPAGWTVGPTSDHSEERHRSWHVVAVDLWSRALRKEYVEATGWTEAEALRDLAALLGGWQVEEVEAVFI